MFAVSLYVEDHEDLPARDGKCMAVGRKASIDRFTLATKCDGFDAGFN